MLNLPYNATLPEIKKYFEQFGEIELCELKYDSEKKSRGFGFIRFKTVAAVKAVLSQKHVLHDRNIEIRFPKEDAKDDIMPTKLFIGRLPRGTTVEELRDHFSEYGSIKDAYIPTPFRGFGFVTFDSPSVADEVMNTTHVIKGTYVNVSQPSTKKQKSEERGPPQGNMGGNMRGQMGGNMQGGNMNAGNMHGGNMRGNMQGNMNMQGGPQPLFGGYGSYYGNGGNNFWGNNK